MDNKNANEKYSRTSKTLRINNLSGRPYEKNSFVYLIKHANIILISNTKSYLALGLFKYALA